MRNEDWYIGCMEADWGEGRNLFCFRSKRGVLMFYVNEDAAYCIGVEANEYREGTMQYHAIPCITADGAYHCPVGSIRPFSLLRLKRRQACLKTNIGWYSKVDKDVKAKWRPNDHTGAHSGSSSILVLIQRLIS